MIRTHKITVPAPKPRLLDPWIDSAVSKLRTVIVSRIQRLKPNPQAALKQRLSEKFKVVEGKKKR